MRAATLGARPLGARAPVRRLARAPHASATFSEGLDVPSPADTARTIVDITAHGTLCTVGADGVPLGE